MHARRRPLLLAAIVAALVLVMLAFLPDPPRVEVEDAVGVETTEPASAGVWYCPSTDGGDGVRLTLAAPPGGGRPALFQANDFGGDDSAVVTGELFPGAGTSRGLEDASRAVEVRWSDRPMVVSRVAEHGGDVPGPVAGPCTSSVSTSWFVPGVTTDAGSTAELHVGNPFTADAAVAVDFFTPAGTESPLAVQNVPVPAGGTTVIDLDEVMPQQEDLGVRVTARSGRVAVEGVQVSVPTINGVQGRSWVGAVERADTSWHLPWVRTAGDDTAGFGADEDQDEDDTPTEAPTDPDDIEVVVEGEARPGAWVWVSNPAGERAELNLSLLTASGRVVPDLVTPLGVEPGAITRIDLEPFLEDLEGDVGVQVVSTNAVPVVVGGGTVVATGGGVDRTGIAVLAGQRSADTSWSLTGPSGPDRRQVLTLGNPDEVTARVSVTAWTGVTSVRPADLQEIVLAPGQTTSVDLDDVDLSAASFTVFVGVIEGRVTASLRSASDDGPLGLSVPPGVPSRIWVSSGIVTVVHREDGMVNRYGTSLGLPAVESDDPTTQPVPDPTPDGEGSETSPEPSPDPSADSDESSTGDGSASPTEGGSDGSGASTTSPDPDRASASPTASDPG